MKRDELKERLKTFAVRIVKLVDKLPNTGYFDDLFKDEIEQLNADVRSGKVEASERNLKREEIIVDGLLRLYTKAGRLVEINGQK